MVAQGISFLSGLAETLKSPEATAQLVDSIVEKDEQTGETSIKIPVESKETVSNLLNLIGKLFAKKVMGKKKLMNKNASAEDAHDAYLKLYDKVYQFDKHIARRYDGMSGGRYYITVCYLYYDGVLTDEDIREFDDELYNSLKEAKKSFQN